MTTPRSDVQYVVTEQGVVNLKPLTTRDRARALIDLARPDCRPELVEAAKKLGIFKLLQADKQTAACPAWGKLPSCFL